MDYTVAQLKTQHAAALAAARRIAEKGERATVADIAEADGHLARADGLAEEIATHNAGGPLHRARELAAGGPHMRGTYSTLSAAARQPTMGEGAMDQNENDDLAGLIAARSLRPGETWSQRARAASGDSEADRYTLTDLLRARLGRFGPRTDAEKRAMAATTDAAGGFLLGESVSASIIDRLRPLNQFLSAGVPEIDVDVFRQRYARIVGDSVVAPHSENQEQLTSNVTFAGILVQPRSIMAVVAPISFELIETADNVGELVSGNLAKVFAEELDRQIGFGTGTLEMTGLVNTVGITPYSMGANGGPIIGYDTFVNARAALLQANAPEPTACVYSVREDTALALAKDNQGRPLMPPPALANLKYYPTSKVPINLTQGDATTAAQMVLGNFRQSCAVAYVLRLKVQTLVERFATQGAIGLVAFLMADLVVFQPASICVVSGVLGTPIQSVG